MSITLVDGKQVSPLTITNDEIAVAAGIETTKLEDGAKLIQSDGSVDFAADQAMGGFKITGLGAPVADDDAATKQYVDTMVDSVFTYKGLWDATGAMPTDPQTGDYWKVSVAGTATIGGVTDVEVRVNDAIIFNGTNWDKIDNTENYSASNGVKLTGFDFSIDLKDDSLITTVDGLAFNISKYVVGENLSAQITGLTRDFSIANAAQLNTLALYFNGIRLSGETTTDTTRPASITEDFAVNFSTGDIWLNTLVKIPKSGDKLLVDYIKEIVAA